MARVSFFMRPEAGHIVPTLRLAAFLRGHGHRICYITTAHYRAFFDRLGVECLTLSVDESEHGHVRDVWSPPASGTTVWRTLKQDVRRAISSGAEQADGSSWEHHVLACVVRSAPDLVVFDITIAPAVGATLAARLSRPMVALALSPVVDKPPAIVPELVLCPVELTTPDEDAARHPGRYYCEPSVWRDRTGLDPAGFAVPDPRPLVYCSLGTQSLNYGEARSALLAVIATFDSLPQYQLLVAATALYEDLAQEPLPENVRLVGSVPQLSVLERAAAIITHGGMSTIKEAIMASVPSIVIPFAYDQPANGRRVEYHGLGRACAPSCCTPVALREIVLDVAGDQAWRRRVAAMSAIFWQRESECRAGHLLLDALAGDGR